MSQFTNFCHFNEHIIEEELNDFGGSEKKKTLIMDDGLRYMLKFPDPTREEKLKLQLSYINNALSEYIGCHVYESVGITVQKTYLGTYTTEKGKEKVACLIKDFRNDGIRLYDADKLELGAIDTESSVTLSSVQDIMHGLKSADPEDMYRKYCDRTVVDALIGNTDRHNGNWGVAKDKNGRINLAPVYDCGSSYSPLLEDKELTEKILKTETTDVVSALHDEKDDHRIKFIDLFRMDIPEITEALKRTVPKINLESIHNVIDEIPYISAQRNSFYKNLTDGRFEAFLIPALERAVGIHKSDEYKDWNSKVISEINRLYIEPFTSIPNGLSGKVMIDGKEILYRKNSDYIFFMDHDSCIAFGSTKKSNQNIGKFVQALRNIGVNVNIDCLKLSTRSMDDEDLDINKKIAEARAEAQNFGTHFESYENTIVNLSKNEIR
jgi:hypothetical protein